MATAWSMELTTFCGALGRAHRTSRMTSMCGGHILGKWPQAERR